MRYALLLSFIGGIIPAVLWLQFWLREAKHREPRRLIVGTFVFGMISVFVAGTLQKGVSVFFIDFTVMSFFLWAMIEEVVKYLGASIVALKTRFVDESIDPMIYLVTSALGFSAAENILFLFEPLAEGDLQTGIQTLSYRFIGATLLHIVASGSVGIMLGFSFYKSKSVRHISLFLGLLIATVLHTAFNSFIIIDASKTKWVLSVLWIGLVAVILILEKIKNIKKISQ